MLVIGNLLLVIAAVLLLALGQLHLTGMPGGDRGVGHAWALMIAHGTLILVLLAITAVLALSGRLPAVSFLSRSRGPAAFAFVAVSAIVAAAVAFASPSGAPSPWSLDAALRLGPLLVPLLLVISAARLINAPAGGVLVPRLLLVVAVLTAGFGPVAAAPSLLQRAREVRARATRDPQALDANQQWTLEQIERGDPSRDFTSLLGYTRDGNHPTIRARALERLQSVPDWEQRTRDALAGPSAPQAFTFLAANPVPDRAAFAAALADGIHQQALLVRERIRRASHPSHLYEGLLVSEILAVLRAVEQFEGLGTDYAPAMRDLRAAFAEPSQYPHPDYRAVAAIDQWLRRR